MNFCLFAFLSISVMSLTSFFSLGFAEEKIKDKYLASREKLIDEIIQDFKETKNFTKRKSPSTSTIQSLRETLRHLFVEDNDRDKAYENRPLSIGFGQTISQPYIVALMTDLLELEKSHRVLEIGTGSGYQAAILSPLVQEVYTIEIIPELYKRAKNILEKLKYKNITVLSGDGYYGHKKKAPYDRIIVTAASSHIPKNLLEQLKIGGKMVIPIGGAFQAQYLMLITKENDKNFKQENILPVRFVPFTGAIDEK